MGEEAAEGRPDAGWLGAADAAGAGVGAAGVRAGMWADVSRVPSLADRTCLGSRLFVDNDGDDGRRDSDGVEEVVDACDGLACDFLAELKARLRSSSSNSLNASPISFSNDSNVLSLKREYKQTNYQTFLRGIKSYLLGDGGGIAFALWRVSQIQVSVIIPARHFSGYFLPKSLRFWVRLGHLFSCNVLKRLSRAETVIKSGSGRGAPPRSTGGA